MIGWLNGQIIERELPGKLVINTHGVGYEVETSLRTFFKLETESEARLYIHTVVREDAFLLYGFFDKEERALFRVLIKINGIGPKMAVTILSSISPEDFIQTVQEQNTALLTKLPGIGKKTAERLLLELKDKLFIWQPAEDTPNRLGTIQSAQNEAIQALESLGYKANEANKVIQQISDNNKGCEQLIREALQLLAVRG